MENPVSYQLPNGLQESAFQWRQKWSHCCSAKLEQVPFERFGYIWMIFVRAPKKCLKKLCASLHLKNMKIMGFTVGRWIIPWSLQVGLGGVYTAAFGECGLDLRGASSLGSGRVGGEWLTENGYIEILPRKLLVTWNWKNITPLEVGKESHLPKRHFLGCMLIFGGVGLEKARSQVQVKTWKISFCLARRFSVRCVSASERTSKRTGQGNA